ncbi:MAG: protein-disulfide reductase DsbD family protein, partial [Hyphomonadaceae bacterium]
MKRVGLAVMAALVLLSAAAGARAAPVRTENVEAELVSSRAAAAPGERFTVALRQKIREGWHTYWLNPGDSGEPTELVWNDAARFAPGPLQWPAPEAIPVGPLTNYGYAGEVLFPVVLTAPADAQPGRTTLTAHARWLVCADICIPEEADLALTIDIAAAGRDDPLWAGPIAAVVAALPKPGGVSARLARAGDHYALEASGGALGAAAIRNPYFFPFAGDAIDHAGAQAPKVRGDAVSLTLTPSVVGNIGKGDLGGVLTFEAREGGRWVRRAVEITATPGAAVTGGGAAGSELGVGLALAFAFLGGLILNVMPCVFPVLSIKALSLARADHAGEARRHGLLFLGGVLATFLALAGGLLALKAAGAAVGWGFQLQEPLVVGGLALLFFAIALNLIGVYEIGGGLQNVGSGLAAGGGDAGAFFTGALAVLAATPCTAPFMGAALGYAATQPAAVSLAVFAALALGFAAPFTALSLIPALRAWLPKPGPWMGRFKVILACAMFAAAGWLGWVLAQQAGAGGGLAVLSACVGLACAGGCWRAYLSPARRWAA